MSKCEVNSISSRMCERGTKGCVVHHQSWLRARAEMAAREVCAECPKITGGYPAKTDQIADAIESCAREFAERVIKESLSEYEIHARGVPARLIELTIAAAEKEET